MTDLKFADRHAKSEPASDIFVVSGTNGNDGGVTRLINLMAVHGKNFYSSGKGSQKQAEGMIGRDNVVIIKVNSQWDQRGGTNTDLVKSVIRAITEHPDGFSGEVVIADNGQAQYGSARQGGNLDWESNNAQDQQQSNRKVADSFNGHRASTYLWDTITTTRVKEYSEGDMDDGYVVNGPPNPVTGMLISYPKFKTRYGTHISLKEGVWDPARKKYDTGRLKFITLPVLKSHFIYGVTGAVKSYMGVVSDKLTDRLGARSHDLVAKGGMGTEMVGTRFPAVSIMDAIWVNAKPAGGPWTPYDAATAINTILASTDPVALDYWAARNILMPAARIQGHADISVLDPENSGGKCFGGWLRPAAAEIARAGYPAVMDDDRINVFTG